MVRKEENEGEKKRKDNWGGSASLMFFGGRKYMGMVHKIWMGKICRHVANYTVRRKNMAYKSF